MSVTPGSAGYENEQVRAPNRVSGTHRYASAQAKPVIPAGAWHRGAIQEPATVLFITPVPSQTQHRKLGR